MATPLTRKQIIAGASEALARGAYSLYSGGDAVEGWPGSDIRLFEDHFGVVAIVVFESWNDLLENWPLAQARFVDLLSERLQKSEPKAWEGYLVLITTESLPPGGEKAADEIRYDMNRVRKLVATGERLESTTEVAEFLAPLMPIEPASVSPGESNLLSALPKLLQTMKIPVEATSTIVDAFESHTPLMEALHEWIVANHYD